MKKITFLLCLCMLLSRADAQSPCSGAAHHQFDFWIGNWEAFSPAGKKAGDSKISAILDSCVILEEWTSAAVVQNVRYAGKSFNTYNVQTGQWQQTWVDNVAGATNYLEGKFEEKKISFKTSPFNIVKDTLAIRKLTFFDLGVDKVRQLGEISKDNGVSWQTEFDLEYRRKK